MIAAAPLVMTSAGASRDRTFATAQVTQPIIRATTDLVVVDVMVTDRKGEPVRGLTREDFTIAEDGRPEQVQSFGFVDIPSKTSTPGGGPPNAASQMDRGATNVLPSDRRIYVIALDAFNVDPSRSDAVRTEARQFINDYVGGDDLAAVVIPGYGLRNQPFTSDKSLLVAAVDQFIGQKGRSGTLNTLDDASRKSAGGKSAGSAAEDVEAGSKAHQAETMLESLRQISQSLGTTTGYRRSIVLFSEGIDLNTTDLIGEDKRPAAGGQGLEHESARYASDVLDDWRRMIETAQRSNVAIYTVEPRGNTMGNEDIMQSTVARDPITGRPMAPATVGTMREAQRGEGSLRTFASETGGLAVVGTDNFSAGFRRIVQANSSYYVLGYRSDNAVHDGKYRKISVSVNAPDAHVVSRQGYYAPAPENAPVARDHQLPPVAGVPAPNEASPRMREILSSPLPVRDGLDVRVVGGPFRRQQNQALVALVVEIDTANLAFVEKAGQISNDIELAFLALDPQGVGRAGNRSVARLALPAADRATVTHGLRYVIEFPVPPERYQLRVGVHESAGDRSGSALLDVDARDFQDSPLALGTILLTTPSAARVPTTGSYPILKASLPTPPTATPEFNREDRLTTLLDVVGQDTATGGVQVVAIIRSADGRDVMRHPFELNGTNALPDKAGYSSVVSIPLAKLSPGAYDLIFHASQSGHAASRSVRFSVR